MHLFYSYLVSVIYRGFVCLTILLPITLASTVTAGVLELKSGDRLSGEVIRIEGGELIWNSPIVGEVAVSKDKVVNLYSNQPMKISGFRRACIIDRMEDEDIVFYCGARVNMRRIPFLSLKTLIPYGDYVSGVYRTTGKLNLWGAYSSGNEVRNEWNLQGEVRMRINEYRHVANAEYAQASWNKNSNKIRWTGVYSFEWFYKPRWFLYNSLGSRMDENRGLQEQWSLGSGLGHQFFETSKSALSQQVGFTYIDQKYEPVKIQNIDFDESSRYGAVRAATDFRHQLAGDVGVFHTNEIIYSLEDSADWHVQSATGLSTKLLSYIFSEVKLEYRVDNIPQPTKRREDVRLSVGLGYKW